MEEYRQKLILREERRRNVLERKKANMNLTIENDQQVPMPSARRRHTDDELIAPSSFDLDEWNMCALFLKPYAHTLSNCNQIINKMKKTEIHAF